MDNMAKAVVTKRWHYLNLLSSISPIMQPANVDFLQRPPLKNSPDAVSVEMNFSCLDYLYKIKIYGRNLIYPRWLTRCIRHTDTHHILFMKILNEHCDVYSAPD